MQRESEALREWLDRIELMHPSEIELGLQRIKTVAHRLELKRLATNQIVVAGTNGKGSTLGLIEQAARAGDYRVGSYTSPHLHFYNERIRINGQPVDDASLIAAFEAIDQARENIPLTYFEFGTLAAMLVLSSAELDVAVLEVGLGGRLDAVNIIDADLAIITSIGLDHTDWLGDDLDTIGREKAGIMRSGAPVLLGETCPPSVSQVAIETGADLWRIHHDFGFKEGAFYSRSLSEPVALSALKTMTLPDNNLALALQASLWLYRKLGADGQVSVDRIWHAFGSFTLPGRMQCLSVRGVSAYLDVGHNPQAAEFLARSVASRRRPGQAVYAVYSSLKEKDARSVVMALSGQVNRWFAAPLDAPRAMQYAELDAALGSASESVLLYAQFEQALKEGLNQAVTDDALVLVFGSFKVVEKAHSLLGAL